MASPRLNAIGRYIRFMQPLWRRAVENDPDPEPPLDAVEGGLAAFDATPLDVLAVLPTHLGRDLDEIRPNVEAYAHQLIEAGTSLDLRIGFYLGLQYRESGQVDRARAFASTLLDALPDEFAGKIAALIRSRIKVDTLNTAYRSAQATGARWILWIDDDIDVAEGGMTALLQAALEREHDDIWTLGLRRTNVRGNDWVSQATAMRRKFSHGQPYPIGCCVLVRTDAPVWPLLRWSDDTWLAARIVDPDGPAPYRRTYIVPTHDVRQAMPQGLGYAWSRIRRIHTNQIMTLANLDPAIGQRYVTAGMFGGVHFRGASLKQIPRLLLSAAWQGFGIGCWITRSLYLGTRGLLRLPVKRPPWAVGDKYVRPTSA